MFYVYEDVEGDNILLWTTTDEDDAHRVCYDYQRYNPGRIFWVDFAGD